MRQISIGSEPTKVEVTAASTTVKLYGAITLFDCVDRFGHITALDVCNNTVLTQPSYVGSGLTALDVSQNTALTHLACVGCTKGR